MKKRADGARDIDECADKIFAVLKEFNSELYFDVELGISICDRDNRQMVIMGNGAEQDTWKGD